jgi:hypothetical protein
VEDGAVFEMELPSEKLVPVKLRRAEKIAHHVASTFDLDSATVQSRAARVSKRQALNGKRHEHEPLAACLRARLWIERLR